MTEYNECECGRPTNGKLRCSSCGCDTCDHCQVFFTLDGTGAAALCYNREWRETSEGILLLTEVSEYDSRNCTLYRRKNEK